MPMSQPSSRLRSARRAVLLTALLCAGAVACDDTQTVTPEQSGGDGGGGGSSGGTDAGAGGGSAGGTDAATGGGLTDLGPVGDAAPGDAGPATPDAYVPPPGGQPCQWASDCPFGDCIEGACNNERPRSCVEGGDAACPEGEVCGGFENSYWCMRPCELDDTCPVRSRACNSNFDCSRRSSCHEGRCTNNCETDADCGERMCYDGACIPYPQVWTGAAPTPRGEPGQLYAGVGTVPLDYPVGVELAGFGAREGPFGPYSVALGGSDRFFEMQDVRVVALSTDEETTLLVRLPLCWSSDLVLSRAAQKLQDLTGVNYRDHIVSSATHSHSQVGRYWTIVPETGFGVFGHGQFSKEVFERITDSVAGAMHEALGDLKPARFGYALRESFDPGNRINSDRRSENADFKDDRALVLRVDDLEGRPMAAVVRVALHGTHMLYPWVTGDAPGAVETIATQNLSAEFGREVPVLFFNGNAGDVSPRGDDGVEVDWGKMQTVGHRMWPIFREMWGSIAPSPELDMELITRRIPVSYRHIGYDAAAREFRSVPDGKPLIYGAFKCVNASIPREDPGYRDGTYVCAIDLEGFRGAPVPEFMKATVSALRLGELVVATLPGEPTSALGDALTRGIDADAEAAGHPEYEAVTFGYSQDHHLYLVPEEDWLHGGYEASQNIWGPKFAQYVSDAVRGLAGELFTPARETVDTGIKASLYDFLPDDAVAPTPTMGLPGGIIESPTGRVPRGALMRVRFNGGHPGVDLPYAHLEYRRDDGVFLPAGRAAGGLVYDNSLYDTVTIYRGDYDTDHTWEIEWELPFDAPLGTYRVHLAGRTFDGSAAVPYDVVSADTFELVPATLAVREVQVDGAAVHVEVTYPDGPTNDDGETPFEALSTRGHLLRTDPERRFDGEAKRYAFILGRDLDPARPVRIALSGAGQASFEAVPQPESAEVELVTSRADDGTEGTTRIGGWPTSRVSINAPGPGRYDVTVTDAFGNLATTSVDVP